MATVAIQKHDHVSLGPASESDRQRERRLRPEILRTRELQQEFQAVLTTTARSQKSRAWPRSWPSFSSQATHSSARRSLLQLLFNSKTNLETMSRHRGCRFPLTCPRARAR